MQASLQSLVWESIVIWLVVLCISQILVSRSVGQWETKNFSGMASVIVIDIDVLCFQSQEFSMMTVIMEDTVLPHRQGTFQVCFILNILEDTILLPWNWRASANCVSALFELHAVLLNYETTSNSCHTIQRGVTAHATRWTNFVCKGFFKFSTK